MRATLIILGLLFATPLSLACQNPKIAGAIDWRPIAYYDTNSQSLKGFAYDIVKILSKQMHWAPHIANVQIPWSRSLMQLKQGKIDIITGIYYTEQRAKSLLYSIPLAEIRNVIFVKKGSAFKFSRFSDLKNKTGGITIGTAIGGGFDEYRAKHLKIIEVNLSKQLVFMLLRGRIDYIPLAYLEGTAMLNDLAVYDKIEILPIPLTSSNLHLAISKQSPCAKLLSKLNTLIAKKRSDGTIERVFEQQVNE